MMQYILLNDMFWLHINHANDPIGIPFGEGDNPRENAERTLKIPIQANSGFMLSYSKPHTGASFRTAHDGYWQKPQKFSEAVVNAYNEAYTRWYPDGETLP